MRSSSFLSAVVSKRLLLGLLLVVLVGPALQAKWLLVRVEPLNGYFEPSPSPAFDWQGLKSNQYQEQLEHYLNDHLGFREWFIRVRNQLEFSLFQRTHANDTVLGQHNVLFQAGHIQSYLGQDFIGDYETSFYAHRMRLVQDDLARQGIQFVYILAPGKPRYQPEDLPLTTQALPAGQSNYQAFAHELAATGVHTFDAVELFKRWKKKAAHPLFPSGGTHWSGYSITLVTDTLLHQLEALGHYDAPGYHTLPGVVTTKDLRFTDNDIMGSLNLIWPPTTYPMAYPTIVFEPLKSTQKKPNVLLVGDSFGQSFYGFYPFLDKLLASPSRFWYYNQAVFWPENLPASEEHDVHKLNLGEQLRGRDAIVLIATEQNMNRCGFGFIDDVYHFYHPYTAADSGRLREIEQKIRQTPDWLDKVNHKAPLEHITVEQAIHNEAYYMRERER